MEIYSVYDKVAKKLLNFFQSENDDDALRTYNTWRNDEKMKSVNFDDFKLIHLGSIDLKKPLIFDTKTYDVSLNDLEDN